MWKTDVRALTVEPFVTVGRDVESSYINPNYLAELNSALDVKGFEQMLSKVIDGLKNQLIEDYVNGRIEIARKTNKVGTLNHGKLATEAATAVGSDARRFAGKSVVRAIRLAFQSEQGKNLATFKSSSRIEDSILVGVAKKAFKTK